MFLHLQTKERPAQTACALIKKHLLRAILTGIITTATVSIADENDTADV